MVLSQTDQALGVYLEGRGETTMTIYAELAEPIQIGKTQVKNRRSAELFRGEEHSLSVCGHGR